MIYMSPHWNPRIYTDSHHFGVIRTPSGGTDIPNGMTWCADNEAFANKFNWQRFHSWLVTMLPNQSRCVFVACPDVVSDAVATIERFRWYSWRIRALGYPVAFVAQDGLESLRWPPSWTYDALFIGGSTEWKLSAAADWCIQKAQGDGKWIHIGRVNSGKRIRHFQLIGADSVDGTTVCFKPDDRYRSLTHALNQQPLFTLEAS